jgi:pyruvate ferredoxin oxidoreductase alpha subunit
MSSADRQGEGAAAAKDLGSTIERAEALVSDVIISTASSDGERHERAPSAAQAVRTAVELSQQGRRASVILAPNELFEALASIHAAARARAPIVVHVAPDGPSGAGRDELAPALELGAGVLAAWSAQDSVDLAFAARRAAEDSETPWIVVAGGAPVETLLPERSVLAKFLGGARTVGQARRATGEARDSLADKRSERVYTSRAPFALGSALRELGELTGRAIPAVERYEVADAEEVIVAVGEAFVAARAVAAAMRNEKKKVGAVGVRSLRPFFASDAVKAMARARAIAVIEPLDVALSPAGPLAESLKAAFADALTWAAGFPGVGKIPPVISVVSATLEGGVSERQVREVLDELAVGDRARRVMVFGSDFAG